MNSGPMIAGSPEDPTKVQEPMEAAVGMFLPINISGAFHSRYVVDARAAFAEYLKDSGSRNCR